ncbi:hypothetical protein LT40_07180 [Pseudomonas rhizosphaerae]|uniref:ORC1/DEAH AAA+ ATPase domain-containing protein n=1 Tax=Pseudomonas rhizosphaerae TaxID=216142 RepID=A0A089YNN0_9PSED|nr:AAA family ATPase [Pseudomonas rhizosphaerae]AIS17199.1 hypothetical protein LT40_07180 [Pseudomonas rhizosphaerae]
MVRKQITEVFTPRSREVNPRMYVPRPYHEKDLARSFSRHTHTLLFGESGNGKTWLYKKVLTESKTPYIAVNCANASRAGSLTAEICNCIIEPGTAIKMKYNAEKAAEINAYFAKGVLKHTDTFDITQEEPLLKAFKLLSEVGNEGKNTKKIIVLDNLESIFNTTQLMTELADLIILLDDSRYADCNINFLIVGVPNGVLHYYRETKNAESVANRIYEIRKVEGLDSGQVLELVKKGFMQLRIEISAEQQIEISDHVWDITLGFAQRVHEYCEALAFEISDNDWSYDSVLLERADDSWLRNSLRHCYGVVESHLNSRETTVARRNQVIYCIGKFTGHQFDSSDIDKLIRKEFPTKVAKHMGVGNILSELTSEPTPLLSRNERTGSYMIRDPKYLMCIKIILKKDRSSAKVIKRNFTRH